MLEKAIADMAPGGITPAAADHAIAWHCPKAPLRSHPSKNNPFPSEDGRTEEVLRS